ncbi:uncharacterized protein FOMMEDRAFT_160145 [Fomitiporia mediterranea MF3/22]|uniref:uncharacterized protein n=1 Tax=Fomitiporia mediterranea (strain MF3/22) TaxID=694068 RepID=UPI000440982C|nr:uncharacterized protein FOMMEDRAFT_160145 [Fomitiporia mediterranea MF3/22]EJC99713.1 hypothetical protein FOMMEDRAFT_160145 [Fomitiporia mediterranea MF3/22]
MIWSIAKRFLIATKTPIDTVRCPRHREDLPKDDVEDAEHTYPGLENIVSSANTDAGHLNYLGTTSYLKTVISMLKGNLIIPVSSYSSNKVLTIVPKRKSLSLVGLRQNQSQSSDKSTSIAGRWHADDLPGRHQATILQEYQLRRPLRLIANSLLRFRYQGKYARRDQTRQDARTTQSAQFDTKPVRYFANPVSDASGLKTRNPNGRPRFQLTPRRVLRPGIHTIYNRTDSGHPLDYQ